MKLARSLAATPMLLLAAMFLPAAVSIALEPARLLEIVRLFADARYQDSRQAMTDLPLHATEPGLVRLWQQRLTTDPAHAEQLALQTVGDRTILLQWRLQAALDGASVALGRQRSDVAWRLLSPLLDESSAALPGEVYLLAGQALRMGGEREGARALLASIRPEDPAFAAARSLLGRIGMETGDYELALHYFESAARRLDPGRYPDLRAGAWLALRLMGRDLEARDTSAQLIREHPFSLAALEVRELIRRDEQEVAVDVHEDPPAQPDRPEPAQESGRFTIQLAAFHDRALGLQFVARWRSEIAGLHIVRGSDALGQPVHRVQVGNFATRLQASTELNRLQRQHGLEGFVTESGE